MQILFMCAFMHLSLCICVYAFTFMCAFSFYASKFIKPDFPFSLFNTSFLTYPLSSFLPLNHLSPFYSFSSI
ncbi:hypothetical protein NBO_60g0006 [Nosema bombycis CQ1]|uniref:Uncharacterized protein n=1 Tax=Nosema bombycis (strain CQ1 / CVCC 102059) TaxID=578461 RepID=R0MHX4_NOSB1|nr:hypothetical protein NBO_60g0006 [Nosema bombycis CQ1]|eukprot:EOB13750.1 hypothetical protein NBO_60g0006 [Nosema bombycis CQ1]